MFFTLNREDFSFVIHLDRQPRTSRRREAQTGSRARSGSRSERTLDAVEHSRTLMEWWPFLIFHRGGLRIKVINNKRLIAESCRKQDIEPDQLTLHADRGSSMRSKPVGLLLADLGVTKTHSRPYVSNDNPYSESQFKTMKYCPQFPSRFGSAEDGRLFCCGFFAYYNFHHRHSGIGLMTPADVHYGRAEQLTTARRQILLEAQQAYPERFVRGTPQPPVLPPQGRCCTARSKSLTSLCRLQSHPAQYVSGIPSAAILLSISHPIRCSTRCLANVRARISGPMIAL